VLAAESRIKLYSLLDKCEQFSQNVIEGTIILEQARAGNESVLSEPLLICQQACCCISGIHLYTR
jgi:hypothetical protein